MEITVAQLAERIGAETVGKTDGADQLIVSVAPADTAGPGEVTFLANDKHRAAVEACDAGAVIVAERLEGLDKPQLLVENVDAALIEALTLFAPKLKPAPEGIDSTAKVAEDAKIGPGASVGPGVVIGDGAEIGENSVIGSGCKIGENSKVGANCRLDSNVVVYHNCRLGDNVIIQANSTIGATGFGYSFIDGSHRLIPHNGGVVIEDFVEIGANCCIDRAKFDNTVIGAGTKVDNLVQIGHNVRMGKCCLIAALVGISGSCKLGDGVVLGGQVGLVDNIELGSGAMIGAKSGVMKDVEAGQKMIGAPALEQREAFRIMSLTMRLPEFAKQLKQLSKRMESLEAAKDDKN